MRKSAVIAIGLLTLGVVGCASQSTQLAQRQPDAIATAEKRAQFDFSCPAAKGEALSSDYIQPAVSGGRFMAVQGVTRLEYTVGVEGCGKKEVYVVMCQEGTSSCFASLTRETSGQ
jgi:hypothetical protein